MKWALITCVGGSLLAAVAAGPAGGSGVRPTPDVQQLYRSATDTVRHARSGRLAKATLYEADGSTTGGRAVRTAAGITRWHFVFDNPTPGSPYAHATVDYGPPPRTYGPVLAYGTPYLEDIEISSAPTISLRQAVALLRQAGEHRAFDSVTLRNPVAPPFDGARYIFGLVKSGKTTFVALSATTGKLIR